MIQWNTELYHHGIRKQKWGVRNGPPYPLRGGDYSEPERKAVYRARKSHNSIYNKRHFDEVMKADKTKLHTLSYDENRTKNADMFYATHNRLDSHQYNALFNRPAPEDILDENGNKIGTDLHMKYRIDNNIKTDMKIASEDSGAKIFGALYKKDRDFYNFVTDEDRMRSYFVDSKYKFKGYREARTVLQKIDSGTYTPTSKDIQKVYRMFNYVIPYDGAGDAWKGSDMALQRAKFFAACKDAGYGAVLDTNDAIYGGFKAKSPIIVFDMEQVIPDRVYQTRKRDQNFSKAVLVGRKVLRM